MFATLFEKFGQVIEVPNATQRIHKLYIDWDKMVPSGLDKEDFRKVALNSPAEFLKILHKVGASSLHAAQVKVIVKVCSPPATTPAI
jgi:hypothetical protein